MNLPPWRRVQKITTSSSSKALVDAKFINALHYEDARCELDAFTPDDLKYQSNQTMFYSQIIEAFRPYEKTFLSLRQQDDDLWYKIEVTFKDHQYVYSPHYTKDSKVYNANWYCVVDPNFIHPWVNEAVLIRTVQPSTFTGRFDLYLK